MLSVEDKYILSLSDKMHESKQDLLNFVSWYHGNFSEEYWQTDFLVQSDSDLHMWIDNCFEGNFDDINTYNQKLRRWKIEQHIEDSYDEFKDLLELDIEDFISTYFQQYPLSRWVEELEAYLGHSSVQELYELHRQYPYARIEYLTGC